MGFWVNPDQLREHGTAIEKLGTGSAGELSRWHAQAAGRGTPWGTDEGGAAFGAAYQELTSLAGEVLTLITEGMKTAGHNLRVMGEDYDAMDGRARDALERIAGELGGPA